MAIQISMPIFATVFLALDEASVPFLVIGGHAVVLHGHLRNTFDLDLLVPDSKCAMARAALINLGYQTYFETDAFLQLQAPENLPPLDLMIVDDQTFGRIQVTADRKILDGRPIQIPDALRLIALKLHAMRDPARRTTETDWHDIAGLLQPLTEALKIPSCRRLLLNMGELERLLKSKDGSASHDRPELLSLPTPREPLREWTEQEIKPGVMVATMEVAMQIAGSLPDFKSRRLARKTVTKFRY